MEVWKNLQPASALKSAFRRRAYVHVDIVHEALLSRFVIHVIEAYNASFTRIPQPRILQNLSPAPLPSHSGVYAEHLFHLQT